MNLISHDGPVDHAFDALSSLAAHVDAVREEYALRAKLLQWQMKIKGQFRSPLVQPHRCVPSLLYNTRQLLIPNRSHSFSRMIMDGQLDLELVVRRSTRTVEVCDELGSPRKIRLESI